MTKHSILILMDWISRKGRLAIVKRGHYNQMNLLLKTITQSMELYQLKMINLIKQWQL